MAAPTIAAGYPKAFLEFAVSRGADRKALLARSGIAAETLENQDARVPLDAYLALMRAAIALQDNPAYALEFGKAVRMQELSIVGLICEACETTAEVGRQLNRYARLVVDGSGPTSPDIVRGGADEHGVWMEGAGHFFNHPLLCEAEFSRLLWNARAMFASDPAFKAMQFPRAVHFSHPEPANRADYERILAAPVVFGSRRNGILFDPDFLKLRQPPVNRYVFAVLSDKAESLLKALESSKTTRGRVESLIIPILHTGDVSMDRIAAKMGLSRQTLLRRLRGEGTTFEKVLDELRHRLALDFLQRRKVTRNQTAYLVGFSDPASFSRAFKRWTGSTPRRYGREAGEH